MREGSILPPESEAASLVATRSAAGAGAGAGAGGDDDIVVDATACSATTKGTCGDGDNDNDDDNYDDEEGGEEEEEDTKPSSLPAGAASSAAMACPSSCAVTETTAASSSSWSWSSRKRTTWYDTRFSCNICLDPVVEPVVTRCGHLYCWPCLYRWLQPGMLPQEREALIRDAAANDGNAAAAGAGTRINHWSWNYNGPSAMRMGALPVDQGRRCCPVCKASCAVPTLVPLYIRNEPPRPHWRNSTNRKKTNYSNNNNTNINTNINTLPQHHHPNDDNKHCTQNPPHKDQQQPQNIRALVDPPPASEDSVETGNDTATLDNTDVTDLNALDVDKDDTQHLDVDEFHLEEHPEIHDVASMGADVTLPTTNVSPPSTNSASTPPSILSTTGLRRRLRWNDGGQGETNDDNPTIATSSSSRSEGIPSRPTPPPPPPSSHVPHHHHYQRGRGTTGLALPLSHYHQQQQQQPPSIRAARMGHIPLHPAGSVHAPSMAMTGATAGATAVASSSSSSSSPTTAMERTIPMPQSQRLTTTHRPSLNYGLAMSVQQSLWRSLLMGTSNTATAHPNVSSHDGYDYSYGYGHGNTIPPIHRRHRQSQQQQQQQQQQREQEGGGGGDVGQETVSTIGGISGNNPNVMGGSTTISRGSANTATTDATSMIQPFHSFPTTAAVAGGGASPDDMTMMMMTEDSTTATEFLSRLLLMLVSFVVLCLLLF